MHRVKVLAPLPVLLMLVGCGGIERDPVIAKAEDSVKAELRDPDSAKFSDVHRCGNSSVVTGKLNAKNIYGALSGNVDFFVENFDIVVVPLARDGPFTDQFAEANRNAGSLIIERCTAAIQGKPLPTQSSALDALDMNATTDMNATDTNLATMNAADADDWALSQDELHPDPAPDQSEASTQSTNDASNAAGE